MTGFVFAAAALGADRVELERVELPCKIAQSGEQMQIEQLAINSELGNISVSGNVKTSDFSAENPLHALARETYEVKGQIDVAPLARMLRNTLQLRQGTEITAGQVALALSSQTQPTGVAWTGRIEASQLAGQADGRQLTWEKPLSIEFTTHETSDGVVVDSAQCESDFLQIDASGSIDNLKASATFDLAQLVTQLRRFSDLNHVQLSGQGRAQGVWKRMAQDQFIASGSFEATGFQYATANGRTWREDKLTAAFDASGLLRQNKVNRVDSAQLTIDVAGERMEAKLDEPASDPLNATWPLTCSWSGQLAHWGPRIEVCLGIAGYDVAGDGTMQATVRGSAQSIAVERLKANFTQFQASGPGWLVREPAVSATLDARWDLPTSSVEITAGQLSAAPSVITVSHAVLQQQTGWSLEGGQAQFDGDLAQWDRWRRDPRASATWNVAGHITGQSELKFDRGVATGTLDAAIENLQFVSLARSATHGAPGAKWQQQRMRLAAGGSYQPDTAQLQLEKLQVASDTLECDASGRIAITADGGTADLDGTVKYDWQQLAPFWQPYLGAAVQVSGSDTRKFALHGPWHGDPFQSESWRQLQGDASIGWAGMNVYGLVVAEGEIAAQLANGQLRTHAIDVAVNEGRLTVTPVVRVAPGPAELLLSGGPLLTDVHLSPELCARGMKFVAPILAESTVADGRFSIQLDGGWVPLFDPSHGDVSGRMSLRAQANPGPLAQQFLILLRELTTVLRKGVLADVNEQSGSLLSVDDSNIEFRMVNGRIYHRGLQFTTGAVPVTTYGSVGLDESLAIIAEIPLRATLFGRDLTFGAMEGRTLQIPIDGTLGNPKLDRRALGQLTGKALQNTARDVLIDGVGGVGRQLERLFPGQP